MTILSDSSHIYCTWGHRKILPKELFRKFKDLDHFLKQLLASANESILIIAPYLSVEGIKLIKDSIFMSAERGTWVRIVTSYVENESDQNKKALIELGQGAQGRIIRSRLRVLTGSASLSILLHSKIIIIDSKCGYLGSANITFHAFEKNFEVGVALSADQSASIEKLVSFWESSSLLIDITPTVFASTYLGTRYSFI